MAHAEATCGGFAIEPDDLARLELSMRRRGYDPDEVQAVLASTTETVRSLQAENDALRRRLEEFEAGGPLGEEMVDEARLVRRRMLEDLARRRAAMGRQIEQLRAGRDRLLEAFEVSRQSIDEATQELTVAMPQAQAAAARAASRAPDVASVEDLEEELEMARVAGLPIIQAPGSDEDDEAEHAIVEDHVIDDETDVEGLFERLRAESTKPAEAEQPIKAEQPTKAVPGAEAAEAEDEANVDAAPPREPDEEDDGEEEPVEPLTLVEDALARRLKRALSDEQNAALERVRSRRARTALDADRILGGSASERLPRYELVAAPHLDEAAAMAGGADVGDLATQLADRIVSGTHADVAAAVDSAQDDEELGRLLRGCFRRVKTEQIGELAAEFVQAAAAPDGSG